LRWSIGNVIQHGGLFPHFAVARNMALVQRIENWPRRRKSHEYVTMSHT
jgi:ABC-type proline/glycine betaine transport system ATPase subunit